MTQKFYLVVLTCCLLVFGCREKNNKDQLINYPDFIKAFNEELKSNTYFGVDSIKNYGPFIDTIHLFGPEARKAVQYASTQYYIHYDTVRTVLNISLYPNLEEKDVPDLRDMFIIIKRYEDLSAYIELGNLFCAITLDDKLGNKTFPYLQNVKIQLLEKYISFLEAKKFLLAH